MSSNRGKRKKGSENDYEEHQELKKKASTVEYNLDTETLLIQTKRCNEAAKVLHKQRKNIERKREKGSSKELPKCMEKYDGKLPEIEEAVDIVKTTLEKIPRKLIKTTSMREEKRDKKRLERSADYSGDDENIDGEYRLEHSPRARKPRRDNVTEELEQQITALEKEKEDLQTQLKDERNEKDDYRKRLEQIPKTHVTIDVFNELKQQKDLLYQDLQEMKNEKADASDRLQQNQDKYKEEINSLNLKYQTEQEAKQNAIKSLQSEVDKIREEKETLSLQYEAEKKAKGEATTSLEQLKTTHCPKETVDVLERQALSLTNEREDLCKKLNEATAAMDENINRLQQDVERMRQERDDVIQQRNSEMEENDWLTETLNKIKQDKENLSDQWRNEQEAKKDALRSLDQLKTTHCPKETVDELERQLISLTKEREDLSKELNVTTAAMDEDIKSFQRERDDYRKQYEAEKEADDNAIRRLQQEKDKLKYERDNAKTQYKAEQAAKDDAINRLSLMASSKLRDNNPNITDLSDQNRPTKISEKLSELYDNQWTDAFDALEQHNKEEREIIDILLEAMMTAFEECSKLANDNYFETVQRAIECRKQGQKSSPYQIVMSDQLKQEVKEFRKTQASKVLEDIKEIVYPKIHLSEYNSEDIESYISICIEISWLMAVQDPPLVLDDKAAGIFDTGRFKDYTRRGPLVEFVVWPALLLHESGPLLSKGVAQGCELQPINQNQEQLKNGQQLFTQSLRLLNRDDNENDERSKMAATFSGVVPVNNQLENPLADDES